MKYKQQLKQWARRNRDIYLLRTKDSKTWTYKRLGTRYGITKQRVAQLFQREKARRGFV